MPTRYLFAGVPVARLDSALAWYERFLGRPADTFPNEHEAAWQLTETGLIYVVADRSRAGKGLITLMVDDLDERLAALAERGIAVGTVETAPGLYRKVVFVDPDGNMIQIGEPLSASAEA